MTKFYDREAETETLPEEPTPEEARAKRAEERKAERAKRLTESEESRSFSDTIRQAKPRF